MNDDLEAMDGLCAKIIEQRDRIEALKAALREITKWSRQNPEANAGDHAGEELLAIVSRIAALAPEQDK